MTTTTDWQPSNRIARMRAEFLEALPMHFERLRWDQHQLSAHQTERLRTLLRIALADSPFHRRRLGNLDLDSFVLGDLATLPTMTKSEMMAAYDDVVTDRRLSLAAVNRHLESVDQRPSLLLDRYVVLATGGSSGVRGVFAADISGAAQHMVAVIRGGLAELAQAIGWPPPGPAPMAIVAAPSCIHATRCLSSLFLPGRLATVTFAPVTLALRDIIDRVQRAQPLILVGFPSVIARLADAQSRGELDISPIVVAVTGEQLTTDHVDRITTGLGVPPTNSYGTSEGLMGTAPPGSDEFDFCSDLAIIEFVDRDDQPIPAGEAADHILITNRFTSSQPLIRYRIDDVMTPAPPSPVHGHQRATAQGRNDEELHLGGVAIHPITIRTLMAANPEITEFQIELRPIDEVHVNVVTTADINPRSIEGTIRTALTEAGSHPGAIVATVVDRISRDPKTGKARLFTTG